MEQARSKGIVKIIICRVDKTGNLLPIEPCSCCQDIADKLGIELVSVPRNTVGGDKKCKNYLFGWKK